MINSMIPEYSSEIIQDLDTLILGFPSEEILYSEDGLFSTNDYTNEEGRDWREFIEIHDVEKHIIKEAKRLSKTEKEFNDMLYNSTEQYPNGWPPFEPGVSAITIAFSAIGGAPVSSCRSHPGLNKSERSPYVSGWIAEYDAKRILSSAKGLEIAVRNNEIEGAEGIIIYANDILTLLNFSKKLYDDQRL